MPELAHLPSVADREIFEGQALCSQSYSFLLPFVTTFLLGPNISLVLLFTYVQKNK
jgi:hypothetical protein